MGKVKGSVCWREDGSKEMWQEEGMRSDYGVRVIYLSC